LEDKVPVHIRRERSKKLQELSDSKKEEFYAQNKGLLKKVLFESDIKHNHIYGFTDNYIRVKTAYKPELINTVCEVRLIAVDKEGVYDVEIR